VSAQNSPADGYFLVLIETAHDDELVEREQGEIEHHASLREL